MGGGSALSGASTVGHPTALSDCINSCCLIMLGQCNPDVMKRDLTGRPQQMYVEETVTFCVRLVKLRWSIARNG